MSFKSRGIPAPVPAMVVAAALFWSSTIFRSTYVAISLRWLFNELIPSSIWSSFVLLQLHFSNKKVALRTRWLVERLKDKFENDLYMLNVIFRTSFSGNEMPFMFESNSLIFLADGYLFSPVLHSPLETRTGSSLSHGKCIAFVWIEHYNIFFQPSLVFKHEKFVWALGNAGKSGLGEDFKIPTMYFNISLTMSETILANYSLDLS